LSFKELASSSSLRFVPKGLPIDKIQLNKGKIKTPILATRIIYRRRSRTIGLRATVLIAARGYCSQGGGKYESQG